MIIEMTNILDHAAVVAARISEDVGDNLLVCIGNSPIEPAMAARYMRKKRGQEPMRMKLFPYSNADRAFAKNITAGIEKQFERLFDFIDRPENADRKIILLDYMHGGGTMQSFVRDFLNYYAQRHAQEDRAVVNGRLRKLIARLDICNLRNSWRVGQFVITVPQVGEEQAIGVHFPSDFPETYKKNPSLPSGMALIRERTLGGVPENYEAYLDAKAGGRFVAYYNRPAQQVPLVALVAHAAAEGEEAKQDVLKRWGVEVGAMPYAFRKDDAHLEPKDPVTWRHYLERLKAAVDRYIENNPMPAAPAGKPKSAPVNNNLA